MATGRLHRGSAKRFALTVAIFAGSLSAVAQEPRRPDQETFLSRAVFADGQLWLLSDAGVLTRLAQSASESVEVTLPEPAIDLWVQDGQPAVITCGRAVCTEWTLRRRDSSGDWKIATRVDAQGERPVAVASTGAAITVLTRSRIIDVAEGKQSAIAFSGPLRSKPVASTHVTPTSIYVGFNMGEWGGGLQRINRKTGEVASIERNESGELCGGPLNSKCDPVNGIATAPWNSDCIVAAVGLVHFEPTGRIVEVCGAVVRRLYVRASAWTLFGDSKQNRPDQNRPDADLFPSEAFFGLIRQGDTLWAAGTEGIYKIGRDSSVRVHPLPEFKRVGDFYVSFDFPDIVVVLTHINRRFSVSGAAPMLVPRQ